MIKNNYIFLTVSIIENNIGFNESGKVWFDRQDRGKFINNRVYFKPLYNARSFWWLLLIAVFDVQN